MGPLNVLARSGPGNVLSAIGRTPVVRVASLSLPGVDVVAKLEGANPSGSVKDRCALFLIRAAQRTTSLDGRILLDASSGNLGSAVAMVGAALGVSTRLVVSDTLTHEKRRAMELLGASLEVVQGTSLDGARHCARLARTDSRFLFLDQFHNPANVQAHYETTGPEILEQVPDVTAYVCALGSGGSLVGVARFLRERGNTAKVHAVTAVDGARIPGLRNPGEEGGYPPLTDMSVVDEEHRVGVEEAITTIQHVARHDGLLLGLSSGGVLSVAAKLARSGKVTGSIVVLCGDSALKYLSGTLAGV